MAHPIHDERYQRVASLLAELRKERHLLQQEVAARLAKPQSYCSKYESGGRRLDIIETLDVLRALGVEPQEFIDRLQDSGPPEALPR
jgi:transcriptional regulator with XRE-family HTH domain